MATIYIYPVEIASNKQEEESIPSTNINTLNPNGLSRIIEIPIGLLDKSDTSPVSTEQMFWISKNNSQKSTANACDAINNSNTISNNNSNAEVTHSFANRKRSIVKRRKSVLSAVYTATSSPETTPNDPQQLIASNGNADLHQIRQENDCLKPKMANIMMDDQDNYVNNTLTPVSLAESRGTSYPLSSGGVELNLQHEPLKTLNDTLVYLPAEEEKDDICQKNEKIIPKDSAIDLRTVSLEEKMKEKCIKAVEMTTTNSESGVTKTIDLAIATPIITPNSLSLPPPSPSLTPVNTDTTPKKKKVSSWSPRRIFQSNDNILHKTPKQEKQTSGTVVTNEEKTKQSKISSLFSSLSSSTKNSNKIPTKSSVLMHTNAISETPKNSQLNTYNYTRLPIHTERAIYRLSHMKLSNPRRSLCDQVIISNLMFWYLSIISQQVNNNNNNNNTDLKVDLSVPSPIIANTPLTKKACRIPVQPRKISHKKSNRKIKHHQIGPATDSNAMNTLKQPRKIPMGRNVPKLHKSTHLRSSNSSSEEEGEEDFGFSDNDLSDDSDEGIITDINAGIKKKKVGKGKKHAIFNISSKKNSNGWFSSFSSSKQQGVGCSQDEDDIPLAMYQKGKA